MAQSDDDKAPVSKSQAKRDAKAIEALATFLIEMSAERRRDLPIDAELIDVATFAATLARGAARRERLRLAKLLRADEGAVAALKTERDQAVRIDRDQRDAFRQTETLRADWIAGDPSADEQIRRCADTAQLDRLLTLRNRYQSSHDVRERKRSFREIFRELAALQSPERGDTTP